MTVKIPDPAERLLPAGLHRLIFRDQKPPFLQIIPLNRPVVAIVAHRILLPLRKDSISELVNMHNCEERLVRRSSTSEGGSDEAIQTPSFRDDAKHRARNLE